MVFKIGKLFSANTLVGTDDNDMLIGGFANDIFIGGKGSDFMIGGAGMDTVDYSASSAPVTVNLATGKGSGGDAQGDTLISIEKVIGSAYDDTLIGDKGNNSFTGGAGKDVFVMSAGNDTITDFTTIEQVVIDFNDRPDGAGNIPTGYGGLNWDNVGTFVGEGVSGYQNAGLGTIVAFNLGGTEGKFSAVGEDFTLKSAYMAAAWLDDLQVTVQGWDDGVVKVTQTFTLGVERTLINFIDFTSIDAVTFVGIGGTKHDGYEGKGRVIAFDDLKLVSDGAEDRIDVPDGTGVGALVVSAVTDGLGGTLLIHSTGTIHLVGVPPQDVKSDWFI